MRPFLRACWLASSSGGMLGNAEPSARSIKEYVDEITRSPDAGASAAYRLVQGSRVMESIRARLDELDAGAYPVLPDCLILTELETLDAAMALEAHLDARTGGANTLQVVVRGVYREITFTPGVEEGPSSAFARAIQFGTFNMRSAEDEWAVTAWYRTRRLPSFSEIKGGIRARRFVSVCGGPAKFAVLYEFTSLEDRAKYFEPLETTDHDEARPTAASRTVHPPMSPGIGSALPLVGREV